MAKRARKVARPTKRKKKSNVRPARPVRSRKNQTRREKKPARKPHARKPAKKTRRKSNVGRSKPSRVLTCRQEAERIASWAADFVTTGRQKVRVTSEWVEDRKPHAARARATWRRPVLPDTRAIPPELPVTNVSGRLANIRVLLVPFDDATLGAGEWMSVTALDDNWHKLRADFRAGLREPYRGDVFGGGEKGVMGISVQVSDDLSERTMRRRAKEEEARRAKRRAKRKAKAKK